MDCLEVADSRCTHSSQLQNAKLYFLCKISVNGLRVSATVGLYSLFSMTFLKLNRKDGDRGGAGFGFNLNG